MKKSTAARIRLAVEALGGQGTIADVSAATRLSYSTVERTLKQISSPVDGTWPVEYSLTGHVPDAAFVEDGATSIKLRPFEEQNIPDIWHKSRRKILDKLMSTLINPDSDPKEVVKTFQNAAEVFGSLAHFIEKEVEFPDWYQRIGGTFDDEHNE